MRGVAWTAVAALAALMAACSGGSGDLSPSPSVSAAAVDPDRPLEDQMYDAVRAGDAELVRLLVEAGVDVDAEIAGRSAALHLAVTRGDADLVREILAAGPDLAKVDEKGLAVVNLACRQGAPYEVVEMLLQAGAPIDAITPYGSGDYPMPGGYALQECAANNNLEGLKALIDAGVDIDLRSAEYQATAILVAAWAGHDEVVGFLLDEGADITIMDVDGGTPLSWALSYNRVEVVQLLQAAGA